MTINTTLLSIPNLNNFNEMERGERINRLSDLQCSICLESIEEGAAIHIYCADMRHAIHSECANPLVRACPSCRVPAQDPQVRLPQINRTRQWTRERKFECALATFFFLAIGGLGFAPLYSH